MREIKERMLDLENLEGDDSDPWLGILDATTVTDLSDGFNARGSRHCHLG